MFGSRLAQLRSFRLSSLLNLEFSACACASPGALQVSKPEPGSVSEYHQHVLVKLNPPEGYQAAERQHGSWWPKFVEKDPSVFEAFRSLAKHQDLVSSSVKVTAFDDVGSRQPLAEGTCELLAFPEGVRYRNLPLASLGEVVLRVVADDPSDLPPLPKEVQQLQEQVGEVVLLVCCHGARDARCGTVGPALAARLLALIRLKDLQERIRVYRTSHIGGHKYAGNVVAYGAIHPCDGDVFGGLSADNAEEFLDALAEIEIGMDGGAEDPLLRQWWRGRMGLSKAEQLELFEGGGGIETVTEEGAESEEEEEDLWDDELEAALEEATGGRGRGGPGAPS